MTPEPDNTDARQYRLAQAERLRRYCEDQGHDLQAVMTGTLVLDLSGITDARQYRLAQAERLRRYCEDQGHDLQAVMTGTLVLDLSGITDERGKIVPEPVDLDAVRQPTTHRIRYRE